LRNLLLAFILLLIQLSAAFAEGVAPPIQKHLVENPIFEGQSYILESGRGKSPSILLVHGLGDLASDTWAEVLPELARDYHVLAVDLPGFGRSDKGNALYSPERYAFFLRWVADRFVDGPLILVGHSLGGAVVLRYAATYPRDLERLVVIDAAGILHRKIITREMVGPNLQEKWGFPAGPLRRVDDWIGGVITRLPELPFDVDQILASGLLRGRVLAGDPARIAALALIQEDFSPLLGKVHVPTAVIWGADDRTTPLRTGILLEAVLPRARLQVIPAAGHAPMFDQPMLFASALRAALKDPIIPQPPPTGADRRTGTCNRQSGLTFSGAYERLEINGCGDILLKNFTAREVAITNSRVMIERGEIRGPGTPLQITGSSVTATGLVVAGDTALSATGSRLDFAGTTLIGRVAAGVAELPSTAIFSVSRSESPHFTGYLHGSRNITPERPL
jgi:pimeloyl-ACP methyl ester carboxylesterase